MGYQTAPEAAQSWVHCPQGAICIVHGSLVIGALLLVSKGH